MVSFFGTCYAETPQEAREKLLEKQHRCIVWGSMYGSVAEARNRGFPPEMAYEASLQYITSNKWLTKEKVKKVVNKVYFDPSFANVGGPRFEQQMYNLCFTGENPYQPLK